MYFFNALRGPFALSLFFFAANTAVAATVSNGDFSNGLTDWDRRVCSTICVSDTTDLGEVATNGSDPYLQMTAPTDVLGQRQLEVFQTVTIDDTHTILSFDAGLLSTQDDTGADAPNGTLDFFTLNIQTSTDIERLFFLTSDGATPSGDPGPVVQTVTQNPTGAFFDFHFTADLSALAGQTVDLFFTVASRPDERISVFGVDNIMLSAPPTVPPQVPLPAGVVLLASGLVLLRRMSRR